ncbi:Transposase [Nostoc flagelliforme CCNUN1]|uniref:Transposase n=1 Tax=Nostoc flagelliforme CCNUN1 TaxID=2038116 RepID=A0A2K8SHK9_9NOSO|nr:hypothetical protein [Nostoc flagelliforme]AUB34919.1 Transposase [Nostoc flagelliforme CCNUN1]
MPARGFLTQGQQESLQQAVRESADKHLRERALMLLLQVKCPTAYNTARLSLFWAL